jgi:hypothetical protein
LGRCHAPALAVNIADTIDDARRGFAIAGRGCLVRMGEDEPRYATVAEIAARLEPHADATMLLTAVSEAVERYDPTRDVGPRTLIEATSEHGYSRYQAGRAAKAGEPVPLMEIETNPETPERRRS